MINVNILKRSSLISVKSTKKIINVKIKDGFCSTSPVQFSHCPDLCGCGCGWLMIVVVCLVVVDLCGCGLQRFLYQVRRTLGSLA